MLFRSYKPHCLNKPGRCESLQHPEAAGKEVLAPQLKVGGRTTHSKSLVGPWGCERARTRVGRQARPQRLRRSSLTSMADDMPPPRRHHLSRY